MSYLPISLGAVNLMMWLYLLAIVICIGILLTVEWVMDARRYLDEAQKSAADLLARADAVGDDVVCCSLCCKLFSPWVK